MLIWFQMPILDVAATSDNLFSKKAVFIILGVLVEKCPKQIRAGGFDRILLFITEGLNSDCSLLLNGALFTLWRFVEYFKVSCRCKDGLFSDLIKSHLIMKWLQHFNFLVDSCVIATFSSEKLIGKTFRTNREPYQGNMKFDA